MRARGSFVRGMLVGAGAVLARRYGSAAQFAVEEQREDDGPRQRYGSRAGDIVGLDAANLQSVGGHRSPRFPLLARFMGALLAYYGLTRPGRIGATARAMGMGLLARGTLPHRRAAPADGTRERRQIVDIQKTLFINAPVDRVYRFWGDYENFPLFISHVRDVQDLGHGRSFWTIRGPGGVLIRWKARLTENRPNDVLAWHSEPGAMLENAGIIRFHPVGAGTQLDLRFCYRPPAGGAGRAVASLLGADPRGKLNEDLGRLKALLEATP